jgi:hypothetical protein
MKILPVRVFDWGTAMNDARAVQPDRLFLTLAAGLVAGA